MAETKEEKEEEDEKHTEYLLWSKSKTFPRIFLVNGKQNITTEEKVLK